LVEDDGVVYDARTACKKQLNRPAGRRSFGIEEIFDQELPRHLRVARVIYTGRPKARITNNRRW
jgi:hypothetical protein